MNGFFFIFHSPTYGYAGLPPTYPAGASARPQPTWSPHFGPDGAYLSDDGGDGDDGDDGGDYDDDDDDFVGEDGPSAFF